MQGVVVATIVAKNYLSFARVLADSFRRQHPDVPFFVLLTDEVDDHFDPAAEPFQLLRLSDLKIPNLPRFRFHYSQQELTYAATPYLLSHLLDEGFSRAAFLKQESLVVGDLTPILALLKDNPIVLTPHLLEPLSGAGAIERELNILQSGVYNVGFLGVSESAAAREFLAWWGDRLYEHCRRDVPQGMHFEQRWLDLVPAFFPAARVVRDHGFNVGHWNLPERAINFRGETLLPDGAARMVDGAACRFFRFSGFDPERPQEITRYVRRLDMDDIGETAELFRRYVALLEAAGYHETKTWPYAYGFFDNGALVTDRARRLYRELGREAERFGDALAVAPPHSFYNWLNSHNDDDHSDVRRGAVARLWRAARGHKRGDGNSGSNGNNGGALGRKRNDDPTPTASVASVRQAIPGRRDSPSAGNGAASHATHVAGKELEGVAVATIVAKNYLSFARVLAQSFRRQHPGVPFFVLLTDEVDDYFDPAAEPFQLLHPRELNINELPRLRFQYYRKQFAAAMKPYLLSHLLERGFGSAIFLDPDTLILSDLTALLTEARRHSVTLTPHLLAPLKGDGRAARELNLLQVGVYNGGFVGVSATPGARQFLTWWRRRVSRHCRFDIPQGMHYDQRWLDLAAVFFDGVHILRDPGCNVAYWNLPERDVRLHEHGVTVDGQPCRFFHFSGFDPGRPRGVTRYSERLTMDELGDTAELFRRYLSLVEAAGYHETKAWPYAYDCFDNGAGVTERARRIYRDMGDAVDQFGDPLETAPPHSYARWLRRHDGLLGVSQQAVTRLFAAGRRRLGVGRRRLSAWATRAGDSRR
ncbi:MAG: hypothetical protein QOG71_2804 [Pyrinomonadaceae bacterium]|nr:hypothetical protein [Pyrinomonadaceae bacterium]